MTDKTIVTRDVVEWRVEQVHTPCARCERCAASAIDLARATGSTECTATEVNCGAKVERMHRELTSERTYEVRVDLANGDDWQEPGWHTIVSVGARGDDEALLLAQQLACTPHPGMPEHIQITGARIIH